jgi:type IV secretory pathway TrbF-like protein
MNSYIVEVPYERIELSRYEDNIWKVFWTERVYLKSTGELLSDRKYEAVLYIGFYQSKDDTVRTWNPTGMYVTYMDSDLYRSLV